MDSFESVSVNSNRLLTINCIHPNRKFEKWEKLKTNERLRPPNQDCNLLFQSALCGRSMWIQWGLCYPISMETPSNQSQWECDSPHPSGLGCDSFWQFQQKFLIYLQLISLMQPAESRLQRTATPLRFTPTPLLFFSLIWLRWSPGVQRGSMEVKWQQITDPH